MAERMAPVRASTIRPRLSWLMLLALIASQALALMGCRNDGNAPSAVSAPTPVIFPQACSGQSLVAIDPVRNVGYVAIYQLDPSGNAQLAIVDLTIVAVSIRCLRPSRLQAPFNQFPQFTIHKDRQSSPRRATAPTKCTSMRSIWRRSLLLARPLQPV